MFTISPPIRLAFTEADVASHYGQSGPITVVEMRPHAISPQEKHIAGTCVFTKPPSTTQHVRGFILKRAPGSTPSWDLQPDFPLPAGWGGMSIRGVNDRGDVSGFYFLAGENPPNIQMRLFAKLDGKPPVALSTPQPNSSLFVGVWAIDQDRNIGGEFTSPTGAKAFMAKLKPDGNIDPSTFREFPAERIRSFNTKSDLLWERKIGTVRHFFLRPGPNGAEIPITQTPVLNGLGANANVVNHSDQIVGWLVPNVRGFLGQVVNGVFDGEIWSHPEATIETRLFGFSNHGTVVGTFDNSKMFFFHAS
jgi:hypothetical protein